MSTNDTPPLPALTRLLMVAESIDGHAAIASRAGQMEELEANAAVLREIHAELRAASAAPETSPAIEDDPMLSGWDLVRHRATEALERGHREFERSERAASRSDFQVEELLNADLLRAAAPVAGPETAPADLAALAATNPTPWRLEREFENSEFDDVIVLDADGDEVSLFGIERAVVTAVNAYAARAAAPVAGDPAINTDAGALGATIDALALAAYAAAHGCETDEVDAGDDGLGDVRQVLADAVPGLRAALAGDPAAARTALLALVDAHAKTEVVVIEGDCIPNWGRECGPDCADKTLVHCASCGQQCEAGDCPVIEEIAAALGLSWDVEGDGPKTIRAALATPTTDTTPSPEG